ncbi:hypothetical protein CDN99_13245 [Roseateles aquatilis]|uniref:Ice-binding protein C-terminal domain-containing protein n=1 Tax=Roseateles aquatilis TaxID=431061 RepID=A0A246JCN0_9BURK|nr:PEP-CTERM sorting domain-containing protein [Roseateles aquatilis]OWQ90328.1 hypothetical protein CDN99_13245 [Roseateles aquatilis]
MNRLRSLALSALLVGSSFAAQAGVVDLFGLPGNFNQSSFGASGSQYYAQSIKADDVNWADLSFSLSKLGAGGTFNVLITQAVADAGLPGTGLRPDAAHVLFSTQLTHGGQGDQVFDLALNTGVVSGATYFLVLQGVGGTLSGASVLATQYNGTDKYTSGEFIFANTNADLAGTAGQWSSRASVNEDLVFRAVFDGGNSVPEPDSLMLLALAALAAAGVTRRAKRNA